MKKVQDTKPAQYRVVTTVTIASAPLPLERAMRLFDAVVMTGNYTPDTARRTRVMSVDECERRGIR